MLDSGSVTSLVSVSLLRSLGYKLTDISPASQEFVLADQTPFKILGTIDLDVSLNGLMVPFTFTVAQHLVDSCIIGANFLKYAGAQLDFVDDVVHFFDDLVALPLLSGSSVNYLARIAHNVKLPPNSEALIQAKVPSRFVDHDCYLECAPTLGARGVTLARSLVHPTRTRTVTCQILNPLNSPVFLRAHTPLGLLSQFNWSDPFNKRAMQVPYRTGNAPVGAVQQQPSTFVSHEQRLSDLQNMGITLKQNELTDDQFHKLSAFLFDNKDLFASDVTDLPGSNIMVHHFDTTTEVPVRQKQFRLPPHLEDEMERQVDKLVEAKIITPSLSCWNSPVFLIKKPTKPGDPPKYRFLVDLRRLNSIIVPQYYPLPSMDDCTYLVGQVKPKFFSVIDQTSGYYSLPLSPECAYKTAFTVKNSHYHWLRLPMGLNTSPACYNFAIATLLKDTLSNHGLVYLDDLILMSSTFDHQISLLQRVFAKFREAGLRMNPSKCAFMMDQVKFLGLTLSSRGLFIDESRVNVIRTFPQPLNPKQVKSFLGLAVYFKRFIKNFSTIAYPLRKLLSKDTPWTWGSEQEQAFQQLKDLLCSSPLLQFPDPQKRFYLACDASKHGFGACLMQKDDNDQLRPVAYGGRATRNYEKNYSASELELASLCYAVLHFYQFLAAKEFTVLSDHMSLKYLATLKHGHSRLVRWSVLLSQFRFDVQHVSGINMGHVDSLSRRPYDPEPDDAPPVFDTEPAYLAAISDPFGSWPKDQECRAIKSKQMSRHRRQQKTKHRQQVCDVVTDRRETTATTVSTGNQSQIGRAEEAGVPASAQTAAPEVEAAPLAALPPITFEQQTKSPSFANIITYLTDGTLPNDKATARQVLLQSEQYTIEHGLLVHLGINRQKRLHELDPFIHQVCVPEENRIQLLESMHSETLHSGVDKTYLALKARFWWPSLYSDTREFVRSCARCYEIKADKHFRKTELHPLPVPGLFTRLHADHLGPLKVGNAQTHKFKHILVLIDSLSQACELVPVETTSAKETAVAIYRHWLMRYSCPQELVSDRGPGFCGKVAEVLYSKFGIKHLKTSAYHPATNGKCERFNQTIIQGLRVFCEQQANWPDLLPTIRFAHMVTVSQTLNCSPFYALYKQEPRLGTFHNAVPQETVTPEVTEFLNNMETEFTVLRTMLRDNVADAQQSAANQYNKTAGLTKYKQGEIVYVRNDHTKPGTSKKLQDRYFGAYAISEVHENDVYSLVHIYTGRAYPSRVHANRLRLAHLDRTSLTTKYSKHSPEPSPASEIGENVAAPTIDDDGSGGATPIVATNADTSGTAATESNSVLRQDEEQTLVKLNSTHEEGHTPPPRPAAPNISTQQATQQLSCDSTAEQSTPDNDNAQSATTLSDTSRQQSTTTSVDTQFCLIEDILKRKKLGKFVHYYVKLPSRDNIDRFAWIKATMMPPSIVAKYEAQRSKKRTLSIRRRRFGFAQR